MVANSQRKYLVVLRLSQDKIGNLTRQEEEKWHYLPQKSPSP